MERQWSWHPVKNPRNGHCIGKNQPYPATAPRGINKVGATRWTRDLKSSDDERDGINSYWSTESKAYAVHVIVNTPECYMFLTVLTIPFMTAISTKWEKSDDSNVFREKVDSLNEIITLNWRPKCLLVVLDWHTCAQIPLTFSFITKNNKQIIIEQWTFFFLSIRALCRLKKMTEWNPNWTSPFQWRQRVFTSNKWDYPPRFAQSIGRQTAVCLWFPVKYERSNRKLNECAK